MAGINHAINGPGLGQAGWEADHAITDASAVRTALGLGTLATQSGTFSGTSSGTNTGDQTGGTPAVVLGTANTAGSSANFLRRDDTILAFDATVAAAVGTAATGSQAVAARRDHVHNTGAGTPSTQALGDAAATGTGPAASMTDHKHAMPAASSITGYVFDHVQVTTAAISITATTEGTANTVITANAIAYDGSTAIMVTFYSYDVAPATAAESVSLFLYDGSSSIGYIGYVSKATAAPVCLSVRITPSAATHTYSIRAATTGGTSTVNGGAGGIGAGYPLYIRQTRA